MSTPTSSSPDTTQDRRTKYLETMAAVAESHMAVAETLNTNPLVVLPVRIKERGDTGLIAIAREREGKTVYVPLAILQPLEDIKKALTHVFLDTPVTFVGWESIPGFENTKGVLWKK